MAAWHCPECDRPFGRKNQPHTCVPGRSLDEFFADYDTADRHIFDAVVAPLDGFGDFEIEAVAVGVFLIRARRFVELRPRRRGLELTIKLSRPVDHPSIQRRTQMSTHRWAHLIDIETADMVTDDICALVVEAYAEGSSEDD